MLLFTIAVTILTLTNAQIIPIVPQAVKASPTTTIYVDPAKSSAKKDGTFTVNIKVGDVFDLYSMSVYITFDPTKINFNYKVPAGADPGGGPDVSIGTFFSDWVATTPEDDSVFTVFKSNQTAGWLDLATGLLGAAYGVNGPDGPPTGGTVLIITFRVMQPAPTVIDLVSATMLNHYPAEIPFVLGSDGNYRPGDLAGPGGVTSDGVVNIWDLVYIGLGYGKTVSQLRSPTTNVATAGGGWVTPANAYTSNNVNATSVTSLQATAYYTYGFSTALMTGAIKKVLVGVEIAQDYNASEPEFIYIYVSNDAGVSWSSVKQKLTPLGQETFMWADLTSAYAWTAGMLADALFRVKIEYRKYGTIASQVRLDWIPVKVEYTQTAPFSDPNVDVSGDGSIGAMDLSLVGQSYGS